MFAGCDTRFGRVDLSPNKPGATGLHLGTRRKSYYLGCQSPQRSISVDGAGVMPRILQAISPPLTDRLMLRGGSMFKLQQSDQPDDPRDNLFQPSAGPGRVEGDFSAMTKPSLYTRLVELPRWPRALIVALVAGVAILIRKT